MFREIGIGDDLFYTYLEFRINLAGSLHLAQSNLSPIGELLSTPPRRRSPHLPCALTDLREREHTRRARYLAGKTLTNACNSYHAMQALGFLAATPRRLAAPRGALIGRSRGVCAARPVLRGARRARAHARAHAHAPRMGGDASDGTGPEELMESTDFLERVRGITRASEIGTTSGKVAALLPLATRDENAQVLLHLRVLAAGVAGAAGADRDGAGGHSHRGAVRARERQGKLLSERGGRSHRWAQAVGRV